MFLYFLFDNQPFLLYLLLTLLQPYLSPDQEFTTSKHMKSIISSSDGSTHSFPMSTLPFLSLIIAFTSTHEKKIGLVLRYYYTPFSTIILTSMISSSHSVTSSVQCTCKKTLRNSLNENIHG